MLKIGILDNGNGKATRGLLQDLAVDASIEILHDICQPLDILIVNKVPVDVNFSSARLSPKTIVANSDDKQVLQFISSMEGQIITYGLNPKAAITISSHFDDIYVICIQRAMATIDNVPIMPREFSVSIAGDYKGFNESVMGAAAAALLCGVKFEYSNFTYGCPASPSYHALPCGEAGQRKRKLL